MIRLRQAAGANRLPAAATRVVRCTRSGRFPAIVWRAAKSTAKRLPRCASGWSRKNTEPPSGVAEGGGGFARLPPSTFSPTAQPIEGPPDLIEPDLPLPGHETLPGYNRLIAADLAAACPATGGTVAGGLRIGQGFFRNAAGCWHVRIRRPRWAPGGLAWLWIWEQDPTAPRRYRRRAWLSAHGSHPDRARIGPGCGDPHCVNPVHLIAESLPEPTPAPGQFVWVDEGEGETLVWLPDPAKAERRARSTIDRAGSGAQSERQARAKLTEDAVRAIRAARGLPAAYLARLQGVTPQAVRKVLAGQTWKHVV